VIKVWLSGRMFYVSINGQNLVMIDKIGGAVQGFILGPILFVIYVSPLFHVVNMMITSSQALVSVG
jgi:hypothetical protein